MIRHMKYIPQGNVTIHFVVLLLMFLLVANSRVKSASLYPNEADYLIAAETMPTPVGGMEGIIKKISSMGMIRATKVEGKVYLLVYIDEEGDVDDVKLVKGLGNSCDEAAMEALKRTKFTPAENSGKKVKVKMTLSIAFKII